MSERENLPLEVTPQEAFEAACPSRPLIDIRPAEDAVAGRPAQALELEADQLPGVHQAGFVMCLRGMRSLTTVKRLREQGHEGFQSVRGGFEAWQTAGLPVGLPEGLSATDAERYTRHLVMPQVGAQGQARLNSARVLLVGLGGLNSPAALYLAAAGVGTLGLLDDDQVDRSNLQRQILHGDSRVGQSKVSSAQQTLSALNPDIRLELLESRLTDDNAMGHVQGWDVVVDGTDNFQARYALNRACLKAGVPMVYGAVMRFQGQVSVFCAGADTPCFRCMTPQAPAAADAPSCAEAGVLGVLPGVVGTLQATETLKLLLGLGDSLAGRLLMFDALRMEFHTMGLPRRSDCLDCGPL